MDLGAFIRLTRTEHAFMLCAAVLIGEVVALGKFPDAAFMLLTFLPPFFIELSAFAINDYFDVGTDRKNKRMDRPIVSGEVTPMQALAISLLCAVIGIGAAGFINMNCFIIALVFGVIAFLYSYKLKDIALVGNAYVAFTMAIPFIFGSLAVSPTPSPPVILISLIAFFTGLGREIIGTVRDMEGDKAREGAATLPMIIGAQLSLVFASLLYAAAVILSALPFLMIQEYKGDWNYLFLAGVCDAILLYIAARAPMSSNSFLKEARNLSLVAMGFGLLAFLVGACY